MNDTSSTDLLDGLRLDFIDDIPSRVMAIEDVILWSFD